ncbi:MAG: aquaporin [Fimbriimonas ginsengisoli]|uniref:Aquaporin n=1 Tax=Fimbriimonas ginsengisoli TaxID=1005039 RepID=A0A931LSG2_FIMGI|nr:aquaporin [Fimbriimonas ginsengisoli]
MNVKALAAELVGTFTLLFIGILSGAAATQVGMTAGLVESALGHGLAIGAMVSALGVISGGHFNPAVTCAFLATGRMRIRVGLQYVGAQLVGAFLGAILARWVAVLPAGAGLPAVASISPVQAAVFEAVLTFFLVIVVFGTAVDLRAPKVGGLFIGLTIAVGVLAGGPYTGAAINPARWFGPALLDGNWMNALVYTVGPIFGGIVAGLLYNGLFEDRPMTGKA